MGRILAISSQVARGSVGLSAITAALQRLGHEVVALPTVILSSHLGYPNVAGTKVDVGTLHQMLGALETNGWLAEVDAVLTGYLPSRAHVRFAAEAFARVRAIQPQSLNFCDPVLGDDPEGLYVDPGAAEAVREELLPIADLVSPNRFELSGTIAQNEAPWEGTVAISDPARYAAQAFADTLERKGIHVRDGIATSSDDSPRVSITEVCSSGMA